MGLSSSRSSFVPPVRYSRFGESLDLPVAVQERMEKLGKKRFMTLIFGIVATVLLLLATGKDTHENVLLGFCVNVEPLCLTFVRGCKQCMGWDIRTE